MVDAFVGREREMAVLRAGLDDATSGRGRLFLISGEPGIGKSRLAEEISREAVQRKLRVVWGRCWEGGGAPAYWPIIQILRGFAEWSDFAQLVEALGSGITPLSVLVPEIVRPIPPHGERVHAEHTDPEQARFRLFDAVARLFKCLAGQDPVLVVIDDLHDADAAALQMLRFMARALTAAPVVLIGTHREAEVERSPELRSAVAELAREAVQLPLRGLNPADAAAFVLARAGIAPATRFLATVHSATDGNPLFLGGVLQTLSAEGKLEHQERLTAADLTLPANVRGAIHTRLAGMSTQTEAILSAAATIGNEFGLELLGCIANTPGDEVLAHLDEAVISGVVARIVDSPGHYRFTHALIREAIYDAIGTADRTELHRRIAEEIEKLYAGNIDAHLQELAHHYLEANPSGNAEKAIDYAIRAGHSAYSVFAYAEAREYWKTALGLIDRQGGDESARRASVLSGLSNELITQGPKAVGYLEAALREYEKLGDNRSAVEAHIRLGQYYSRPNMLMDLPRALEHLRKAERFAAGDPTGIALSYILLTRASVCIWSDALNEGIAAARRAIEIGERASVEIICVHATLELGQFLVRQGCVRQGFEMIRRARMKTDSLEERVLGSMVAYSGASLYLMLGDPGAAGTWLRRELSRPRTARSPFRRSVLHKLMSQVCSEAGDLPEGRQHDEYSTILVSPIGTWPPDLYRLFFEGDWDSARKLTTESIDQWAAMGCVWYAIETGLLLARLTRIQGEYGVAGKSVEQVQRRARRGGDVASELRAAAEAVLIFAAAGPTEQAISHLARCHEILGAGEDWRGLAGHVARAEAVVAAAEGQLSDAATPFERAIVIYQHYSLPWEEAEAFYLWGRALLDAGETSSADQKLESAIEIYRRIGAGQAWIDRALAGKARATGAALTLPNAETVCVLRREGEYWTIAYDGRTSRLKDAKGLHYIAYLRAHPGQEIRAIDLAAVCAATSAEAAESASADVLAHSNALARDLGDAGEMLDAQAKADYQRRLTELREELEQAREFGNGDRAEQAQAEIEAIAHELRSAIGLGGRRRRAASSIERARVAVTRAIRLALRKIAESNPALGKLLSATIRTGAVCGYVPDNRSPVRPKL
jgi:tetratricopeptide (TPR) repeat protein